jgi:hypothetical protein
MHDKYIAARGGLFLRMIDETPLETQLATLTGWKADIDASVLNGARYTRAMLARVSERQRMTRQ